MIRKLFKNFFLLTALLSAGTSFSQEKEKPEYSAEIEVDNLYFFEEGLYGGQHRNYLSFSITPDVFIEWKDGKQSLKVTGFLRVDQFDKNRTHTDIRELYWQTVSDNWELSIGVKKIFWGVTESVHLVDIINQTDYVESFDGEQKLGQTMVHWSYMANFGTFDIFYLPYFRKAQFPGEQGRLRTPFLLKRDEIDIDPKSKEFYPSYAGRWSHYAGVFDFGVSYFHGIGREPIFQNLDDLTNFSISYPIIDQTGLDIQATTGPILWKFETVIRKSAVQDLTAFAGGIEYTFGNIKNSGLDIGIVAEYLYDDRGKYAWSGLNNDLFSGVRFAFNDISDTQFLIGGIVDLSRSTKLFSVEGSRRLGESWKGTIESRLLKTVSDEEFTYFLRGDSFLKFSLSKFL